MNNTKERNYINIVKSDLQLMKESRKADKTYGLYTDIISYYENKIKPDNIITSKDLLKLCEVVLSN